MAQMRQYYASPRLSNSMLTLVGQPHLLKWKLENPDAEDDDMKYFRVGSALDTILTAPETFDKQFKVIDANRPWGLMAKFIENLPAGLTKTSDKSNYEKAYEEAGYKMHIDRVIDSLWSRPEYVDYYLSLSALDSEDRVIISRDEYESVMSAKYAVSLNPFTSRYFLSLDANIELHHQIPIYWELDGVQCKSLLDGIMVDHRAKTIQPFDLKTIGKGVYNFPTSFYQFAYFRQAAYYSLALEHWIEQRKDVIDLSGYERKLFQFIVVDSNSKSHSPAIIYQCSEKDLHCGLFGGQVKSGPKVEGVYSLLDAYKWHMSTNEWLLPKRLIDQDGKLLLDIFE